MVRLGGRANVEGEAEPGLGSHPDFLLKQLAGAAFIKIGRSGRRICLGNLLLEGQ